MSERAVVHRAIGAPILAAVAALSACTTASSTPSVPMSNREQIDVGMWSGAALPSDGGPFDRCYIYSHSNVDAGLFLALDKFARFTIGVEHELWHLRRGDRSTVTYMIDDGPIRAADAKVIDARIVEFEVTDEADIAAISGASALVAITAGTTFRFELHDIGPAMVALIDCAKRNTTQSAEGTAASGSEHTDAAGASGASDAPHPVRMKLGPSQFSVGAWLGEFYPRSGERAECGLVTLFGGGRDLYFTFDRNSDFTVSMVWPGVGLSKGRRYSVLLQLDARRYPVHGTATQDDSLDLDRADTRQLFDRFRNASALTVEALGAQTRFRLVGIAEAFDAMRNCVATHAGAATAEAPATGANPFVRPNGGGAQKRPENGAGGPAGGSNPFMRPGTEGAERPQTGANSNPFAPPAPSASGRSAPPDTVAAASDFVERLLGEAGLTDHKILTGAEVPAGDRGFDVVVRIGGQTATLSLVDARRYHSVTEASAAIIKDASQVCDEGFTSSISARRLRDGRPAAQMLASCTRPKTFHVAYTIVPVRDVGYYRLSITTFGDPVEIDVIQARIGAALARVVPEG